MAGCFEQQQKKNQEIEPQHKDQSQAVGNSKPQSQINIFDTLVTKVNLQQGTAVNEPFLTAWFKTEYLRNNYPFQIKKMVSPEPGISVYGVNISNSAPNELTRAYSFIYFESNNALFLLPIEFSHFFNLDDKQMVGGFYNYREFDYYQIFSLKDSIMMLVLDTRSIQGNEVRVGYYRNDECVAYRPERLNLQYDPKMRSIIFTGEMLQYCKGKEDRNPTINMPLDSNKITIKFKFFHSAWIFDRSSQYVFW